MRVAVLGAGAVGSLLGARLSAAHHEVVLVGRANHVRAVRAHGLVVTGDVEGTFRIRAEESVPKEFGPEAILWTVKAVDIASSAAAVAGASPTPVPTLLPQNGLGITTAAAAALRAAGWSAPESVLVRAVNSLPATLLGPGKVRAAGRGELVLPLPVGRNADAVRRLTDLMESAGIQVRTTPDIVREVWRKAVVNAAINPVTAIHAVPNGSLLVEPWRGEALVLLDEARRAAKLAGFEFRETDLLTAFDRIVRATAENRSSMLQDVEAGRPTEIDAISGEILRAAQHAGTDLPATRAAIEALGGKYRPRALP